jgi:hypothetical protein
MKDAILIKPIQLQEYTCKHSKHDVVPKLQMMGIILAPRGSGKTVLLSNRLLHIDLDCFERVYTCSPSVNMDGTWQAVKEYQALVTNFKDTDT